MYRNIRLPKTVEEGGGEAGVSARPASCAELLVAVPEFANDVFEVKVKGEAGVEDGTEVAEGGDFDQELSSVGGVTEGEGPVGWGSTKEGRGGLMKSHNCAFGKREFTAPVLAPPLSAVNELEELGGGGGNEGKIIHE